MWVDNPCSIFICKSILDGVLLVREHIKSLFIFLLVYGERKKGKGLLESGHCFYFIISFIWGLNNFWITAFEENRWLSQILDWLFLFFFFSLAQREWSVSENGSGASLFSFSLFVPLLSSFPHTPIYIFFSLIKIILYIIYYLIILFFCFFSFLDPFYNSSKKKRKK